MSLSQQQQAIFGNLSNTAQNVSRSYKQSTATLSFSVILCTYNRRNLVLSALASLRRQTLSYQQFEVIVVDNGSTDGTFAVVQNYVYAHPTHAQASENAWRVQCLYEPRNGLAYARNKALQAASGEIAVFLDDDSMADPQFLEHLLTAYQETKADAIGGRVELRLEGARPHWLSDDLLDLLGYFAPAQTRMQVQESLSFSGCNFSVRLEVLQALGTFSPFLTKRPHRPASMEVHDLCQRLQKAGYCLWYEPQAVVTHRVPAARLQRPYFTGRAYWQGRSEILSYYANEHIKAQRIEEATHYTMQVILSSLFHDLKEIAHLFFFHRTLQVLAGASTNERLLTAMAQARLWGQFQQKLRFLEHIPAEMTVPAVLFVHAKQRDATVDLFINALHTQPLHCTVSENDIPFAWLWQHRAHDGQSVGIIHMYRPGAFHLSHRQRQRFWFLLRLAHHLGIRVVSTDAGGWWQNTQSTRHRAERAFERTVFQQSHLIFSYTRQPEQLYPEKSVRRRLQCLPHPGFRGYFPPALPREQAQQQLGMVAPIGYVYVCFADQHSERELLYLLQAFAELGRTMHAGKQRRAPTQPARQSPPQSYPQLLLIGTPRDTASPTQLLKQAALNNTVHLFMENAGEADLPLYMGAAHALVIPHFPMQNVGTLETAIMALSYERFVIAPALPRFNGMLPPYMSTLYDPASRTSLIQAMEQAQFHNHRLKEKEVYALDAHSGWSNYAQRMLERYQHLLS